MNKNNLIKLGALAQKQFSMKDNFKIVEALPGNRKHFRVVVLYQVDYTLRPDTQVEFDDVDVNLIQFGSDDSSESIWYGYSVLANMLVIQANLV